MTIHPSNSPKNVSQRRNRTPQNGQSTMEYVVICAAITFALGVGMADDNSALRQLLNAFVLGYKNISFAISLP